MSLRESLDLSAFHTCMHVHAKPEDPDLLRAALEEM